MPIEITMPALSPTMEEGQLASWLVKEGDEVKAGDIIAEIETDKAMLELEADQDGRIAKLLVEASDTPIPVHQPIAIMLRTGEDESSLKEITPPPAAAVSKTPARAASASRPPQTSSTGKEQTMREALRDAMAEEMTADKRVFVFGEEVAQYQGAYKVTQGLLEQFGAARVVDTPITEHGMAGLAIGAAFGGLRPIVEFMTFNFSMQAMDQIINSAAKTHYMSGGLLTCPIVFRGPNGAAKQVAAQHAQDFAAWFAHIPGVLVVAPSNAADAKGMLKAAIRNPNPVLFLEHELLYGNKGLVPEGEHLVPLDKAKVVRAGTDITLVAYSRAVLTALSAAELLAQENISCEVIDLRALRPLDETALIASLSKTHHVLVVEDGWQRCGIGAEVAALLQEKAFDELDAPIMRLSAADVPMPYALNLEQAALPSVAQVIEKARALCR